MLSPNARIRVTPSTGGGGGGGVGGGGGGGGGGVVTGGVGPGPGRSSPHAATANAIARLTAATTALHVVMSVCARGRRSGRTSTALARSRDRSHGTGHARQTISPD